MFFNILLCCSIVCGVKGGACCDEQITISSLCSSHRLHAASERVCLHRASLQNLLISSDLNTLIHFIPDSHFAPPFVRLVALRSAPPHKAHPYVWKGTVTRSPGSGPTVGSGQRFPRFLWHHNGIISRTAAFNWYFYCKGHQANGAVDAL